MAKIMPAASVKHVEPIPGEPVAKASEPPVSVTPVAVDPYLARSVKSSPNGF